MAIIIYYSMITATVWCNVEFLVKILRAPVTNKGKLKIFIIFEETVDTLNTLILSNFSSDLSFKTETYCGNILSIPSVMLKTWQFPSGLSHGCVKIFLFFLLFCLHYELKENVLWRIFYSFLWGVLEALEETFEHIYFLCPLMILRILK
jgi:hypothetical protein